MKKIVVILAALVSIPCFAFSFFFSATCKDSDYCELPTAFKTPSIIKINYGSHSDEILIGNKPFYPIAIQATGHENFYARILSVEYKTEENFTVFLALRPQFGGDTYVERIVFRGGNYSFGAPNTTLIYTGLSENLEKMSKRLRIYKEDGRYNVAPVKTEGPCYHPSCNPAVRIPLR